MTTSRLKKFPGIFIILSLLLVTGCSLMNPKQSTKLNLIEPVTITASPQPGTILETTLFTSELTITELQSKDSWQYLISLFSIPEQNNERINKAVAWYLAHPKYIHTIQTRAEPYLFAIIQAVEKKGLPGEFALLPAVESGFKAHAYSHARAAGLWQFIPSTGKIFGLEQNWWYDGRRDIYASTEAATDYLQKLGKLFNNDWLLALASYNAGQGSVGRSVKRNLAKHQPTDFWSLKLPKETQRYVPKLLALAKIFANAEHYGVSLKTLEHKPAFRAVDLGSQMDLSKAALLSDMTLEELFHLNPGYNRGFTPPKGPHRLLIPVDKAETFAQKLSTLSSKDRIQWKRHKVISGDSLSTIAYRYNTRVKVIREVNFLKKDTIRVGSYLFIPLTHNKINNNPFLQANQLNPNNKHPSYTVKSGDSLWSIARRLDLHSKDIARWNRIGLKTPLRLGQKLIIKNNSHLTRKYTQRKSTIQPISYTVRQGDSLSTISQKFNVRVTDLRKWNKKKLGKYLKPGQSLMVKVDITRPST